MTLIKSISGIRGTLGGKPGQGLTPLDTVKFASAYGKWILSQPPAYDEVKYKVVIGRDARISGKLIADLVIATLRAQGIHVVDLGLSTTPTVEIAVPMEKASGGIILTASHNPANWNALKLLDAEGHFVSAQDSQYILEQAEKADFDYVVSHQLGTLTEDDTYIDKHIAQILALPLVDVAAIKAKNFRVIVDAVNSTGGIAVPQLLAALGVQKVEKMYCEPNGMFPHNPEPLPEHITAISAKMEAGNFHLGIVVDPDVDRLALVCEDGTPFGEEYTLVAVADYVLQHQLGSTVSNMSSTQALRDVTQKAGGQYFASAVGEVNVVAKMKEVGAVIGGEGNGGIIYPELHYGRDALVGIALFLSHLAHFSGTTKMLRMSYPSYHISKNKIEIGSEVNYDGVLEAIKEKYHARPVETIDGVKIFFDKEWVHLRKSNTEPIVRIYAESDTQPTSEHLANKIISDIKEIISFKATE